MLHKSNNEKMGVGQFSGKIRTDTHIHSHESYNDINENFWATFGHKLQYV